MRARTEEYRYALAALAFGFLSFSIMVAGFVFLFIRGHAVPAGFLLGTGVLGLVTGFVRSRLRATTAEDKNTRYRISRPDIT